MTDWIMQHGWPLLAGIAWKSFGLALVSGIVALALSRASAAARHLVWRLCVVGLLLLPALSVFLPGWAVPVPARPADAPVLVATPPPSVPAPAALPVSPSSPRPAASPVRSVPAPAEAAAPPRPPLPWQVWAFGGWAVGGVLVLFPTLLGLIAVRNLERRCRPVTGGPLFDALGALTSRPVRLMTAPADGPAVPMTWGGRRPALLLPLDAGEWPAERLRATLLHELAHIERADWPAQMAAQTACALYWFNPLVWFTARRMAQEAERACDDRVLGAGVVPADYAGHLLDTVRGLQEKPTPAVLPMAQASSLEGRLTAILGKRRRTMLTKRTLWLGGGVTLLVLLPLAAIQPHPAAMLPGGASASTLPALAWQAPLPAGTIIAASGQFSQDTTLPNGIQVKLLGFAQNPSRNVPWSTPDGRAGIKSPYLYASQTENSPLMRSVEFAVYLDGLRLAPPGTVSVAAMSAPRALGGGTSCNITTYVRRGNSFPPRNLQAVVASFPKTGNGFQTGAFLFGVADGPWQTATVKQFTGGVYTGSTQNSEAAILISTSHDLSRPLIVSVADDVAPSVETRIVAVDRRGVSHTPEMLDGGGSETTSFRGAPSLDDAIRSYHNLHQSLVTFPGLPLRDIREVRFQTRPYQWVLFKNLALYPILTPLGGKP